MTLWSGRAGAGALPQIELGLLFHITFVVITAPLWLLSRLEARVAREPNLFQPARARSDAAELRREKREAAPAFDAYRKAAVEAGVHQAMLYGAHSVATGRGLITADQGLQVALGGREAWCFMRRHWRAFRHVPRLATNPLHRTAGALKEVARCSMRRTVLFTVHELQRGWLASWVLGPLGVLPWEKLVLTAVSEEARPSRWVSATPSLVACALTPAAGAG